MFSLFLFCFQFCSLFVVLLVTLFLVLVLLVILTFMFPVFLIEIPALSSLSAFLASLK